MRNLLIIAAGVILMLFAGVRLFSLKFFSNPLQREEEIVGIPSQPSASGATSTDAAVSFPASVRLNFVASTTALSAPENMEKRDVFAESPVIPLPIFSVPTVPMPAVHTVPTEPRPALPAATPTPVFLPKPFPLPPLNLDAIFAAVVKIECPSENRRGKYVGSGFVLSGGAVVSAAHLLMVSGSDTCTVIFPNKDRAPAHWLQGVISEDRAAVRHRHDEEGIDVATLTLAPLSEYPEARAVFPDAYPSIPYPVCEDPDMIGDTLMHFGYPSNFLNQTYLSKADGTAIAYADITGIETLLNQDQTDTYRSPIFSYLTDKYRLHPYMVSRVPSFYGDSGGLAFNATKQCILGPQRGGTIGGGAGENVSVFPVLGWGATKSLLP